MTMCLTNSPNLLKADQAVRSSKRVIEKENLLLPEKLCLAVKPHIMRKTKNTCESIYKMGKIFIKDTYMIFFYI